ncbi:uncharacterized protein LOC113235949 [Hyposmocoma kahamanoa]|uniref:uncharacterized protein LOC113235949 n=1 Tax=Hyposmocoma kahamanoa TaxID=1477025 RepID=UPI000E6D82E0|nr:uncharacterized protein LOC113235949 [Hyposmocoma kahamanoa]
MLRSPISRFGSSPDLSTTSGNISVRKRRHDDDFHQSFNEFTKNIMSTLKEWKIDLEHNFSEINNNVNNVIKQDLTKLTESTIEMKSEIKTILHDFNKFKETVDSMGDKQKALEVEVTALQTSMQFIADKQDDAMKKIDCVTRYTKKIESLETQLNEVKRDNEALRADVNSAEQRERLMNLEIIGIPEAKDENLENIIVKLSNYVGADLSRDDIVHVHRVTPRIKTQGRPRVIVVKFKTRLIRDNILSRARKIPLKTDKLQFEGEVRSVYVNEQLTFVNKQLLKKCKEAAKLKMYQYVWVKNGRIFIRKNDVSPAIPIMKAENLSRIV